MSDERTEASDDNSDDAGVVTGTGTAVTPSDPEEVLRVYSGDVVSDAPTGTTVGPDEPNMVVDEASPVVDETSPGVVETGTGTTVGPAEPSTVVDDTALGVVETGTGMTVGPSEPTMVLELMVTAAVLVFVALAAVSVPVAAESEAPVAEGESVPLADAVAVAVGAGRPLERSVAKDEAAADRMLENWDDRELGTAESVAVAATPESSELSDDAMLDKAAVASLVIEAGTVGLPEKLEA